MLVGGRGCQCGAVRAGVRLATVRWCRLHWSSATAAQNQTPAALLLCQVSPNWRKSEFCCRKKNMQKYGKYVSMKFICKICRNFKLHSPLHFQVHALSSFRAYFVRNACSAHFCIFPCIWVTPDRAVARQVFGFGQLSRMSSEGDTNAR